MKKHEASMIETARAILREMGDSHVVVGPYCWRPVDGTKSRQWYFMLCVCDRRKNWFLCQVDVDGEEIRSGLIMKLIILSREIHAPLFVHDFDDEIRALKFCEMLWPGEKVSKVRAAVELEYAQRSQQ